jgi:hypothetical protein
VDVEKMLVGRAVLALGERSRVHASPQDLARHLLTDSAGKSPTWCWTYSRRIRKPGEEQCNVEKVKEAARGRQELVKPFALRDCTRDHRESGDQVELPVRPTKQAPVESQFFGHT